jgi:undecaprenyl pyrophosphate phosphatase UppP
MSYNFFLELFLEWLPISSSGHILLLSRTFPSFVQPLSSMQNYFAHALMIPFQVAVLVYFLAPVIFAQKNCAQKIFLIGFHSGLITLITGVGYLAMKRINFFISAFFLLSAGFGITFLLLKGIEKKEFLSKNIYNFSFLDACYLGVSQIAALLPGVSRFAAILAMSSWLGYSRTASIHIVLLTNFCLSVGSIILLIIKVRSENVLLGIDFPPLFFVQSLLFSLLGAGGFIFFYSFFLRKNLFFFIWYEFAVCMISLFFLR